MKPRKTFLVTGGCGFIGSHLSEALLARGDSVRVLDDLSSGLLSNLPKGAELIRGSITEPRCVREALAGTDGCFHLAAISSVERSLSDWVGTHRVNLEGTIIIFDELRKLSETRIIPVVYASSAAVYGEASELPLREDMQALPLSAYGADKLGSELHARIATKVFGIPAVGLRLFNVYGPRQDPRSPYSGVISRFCDRLCRGEPVEIFGDGQQQRDFIFVADVVAALLKAMDRPPAGAVLNICTGIGTSIEALAKLVSELGGRQLQIRFSPARPGEIRNSVGSPARAAAALGLSQPTTLREGLPHVLRWLERSLK
ncbi:MAG: NAD-dependent epimerase/dehydratase family protein [Acidobacteriia bacterium]|nr:NAD-dependent epimerase/dehydratase family protein [Methyloceanibacter sp.]MCL6491651.1 NAD-dependent epimerase/dehydratase family protein [Terriglobia bacterium]